jgi:hypothetical protein
MLIKDILREIQSVSSKVDDLLLDVEAIKQKERATENSSFSCHLTSRNPIHWQGHARSSLLGKEVVLSLTQRFTSFLKEKPMATT